MWSRGSMSRLAVLTIAVEEIRTRLRWTEMSSCEWENRSCLRSLAIKWETRQREIFQGHEVAPDSPGESIILWVVLIYSNLLILWWHPRNLHTHLHHHTVSNSFHWYINYASLQGYHVVNASAQYTVNPPTVWPSNINHCDDADMQYHVWSMHLHSTQSTLLLSDQSILFTSTLVLNVKLCQLAK